MQLLISNQMAQEEVYHCPIMNAQVEYAIVLYGSTKEQFAGHIDADGGEMTIWDAMHVFE